MAKRSIFPYTPMILGAAAFCAGCIAATLSITTPVRGIAARGIRLELPHIVHFSRDELRNVDT